MNLGLLGAHAKRQQVLIALSAMQAELVTVKGQVITLQTRLDVLEQQAAGRVQSKTSAERASYSSDQIASLNAVIADCVKLVRASAPHTGTALDDLQSKFWTRFDAFYNPASARVENNVMYNGERPACTRSTSA